MHNNYINKRNSDECIRINTLYNKDDSFDTIKPNHFKNEIINSIQKDDKTNNDSIPDVKINEIKNNNNYKKLELTEKNEFISKAINGLNENNFINNNSKKRIKSMEKIQDNSIRNSYNNNKKNIANKDKNNNKLLLNIGSVPLSNHIYKKLTTYSDKEKIIQKFINLKNTTVTKKEEPKRENTDLENGKHLYQNTKYKYKNRYSQEAIIGHNKHIHNGIISRANGANEMSFANKNINIGTSNINDFIYTKKKNRKTKSIDDNYKRNNSKLFKDLNMKENTNTGFLNRKNSKTNMNSNDYYMKMNNKKILYNKIIKDKKFIDYPYMDSFRYKKASKRQNIGNLNKKLEISDLSDTNHFTNRRNNNHSILEKVKNRDKYAMVSNKEQYNYTNISLNKKPRLKEHNSFDIPRNIKNKFNINYINSSIEKINQNQNNNTNIIQQYNKNYYKLNRKVKNYYRNNNNSKKSPTITQYYGVNNFNIDNYEKFNAKMFLIRRNNNYKLSNHMKSNSVDLQTNNNIDIIQIKEDFS
jgi:hypothetical protein